jgi:hypothetical protein
MYNSPTSKPARTEWRSETDVKPKIFSRKEMKSCHFGGLKQVTTSFERGELPLSNDTIFNFITSLVDIFTGSNFKYVNNFMNVTERDRFDLQVPDVSCM